MRPPIPRWCPSRWSDCVSRPQGYEAFTHSKGLDCVSPSYLSLFFTQLRGGTDCTLQKSADCSLMATPLMKSLGRWFSSRGPPTEDGRTAQAFTFGGACDPCLPRKKNLTNKKELRVTRLRSSGLTPSNSPASTVSVALGSSACEALLPYPDLGLSQVGGTPISHAPLAPLSPPRPHLDLLGQQLVRQVLSVA